MYQNQDFTRSCAKLCVVKRKIFRVITRNFAKLRVVTGKSLMKLMCVLEYKKNP